jgi:hypothetical protein
MKGEDRMIKAPSELIDELSAIFEKYDIFLDVSDEFGGEEQFVGQTVEIKSNSFVNDMLPIYIDDMNELARKINKGRG